jgi:hypothetical protein
MEIVGRAYLANLRTPDPQGSASARRTARFRLDPGNRFPNAVLAVADHTCLDVPAIRASAVEPVFRNGLGGCRESSANHNAHNESGENAAFSQFFGHEPALAQ